jgi:hypothetical protein
MKNVILLAMCLFAIVTISSGESSQPSESADFTLAKNPKADLTVRLDAARNLSVAEKINLQTVLLKRLNKPWDIDVLNDIWVIGLVGNQQALDEFQKPYFVERLVADEGKINGAVVKVKAEIIERLKGSK